MSVLRNTSSVGSITSSSLSGKVDFVTGTNPYSGLAVGDLDGDGRPDLSVGNRGGGTGNTVSVLRNSVAPPHPTISSFSPTSGPIGTTVTITGTNFNTTAAANNIVYFGAVKASVSSATSTSLMVTVPVGATFAPITITDTTTGLTAYSSKPYIVTFSGGAITANSFATKVDFAAGNYPNVVAIADFNNDGKPDLAIANVNGDTISIYKNLSSSGIINTNSFSKTLDILVGSGPIGLAVADLDGDGKLDLVSVNENANTISILRNTSVGGTISFALRTDSTTGRNPYGISITDLDGDGKPDIVVTNSFIGLNGNSISVFHNTSVVGSISFDVKVDFATASVPVGIGITDLDGDGKPDIVVADNNAASISVFRNVSTPGVITSNSFQAKVDYIVGTNPIVVAVGDLDGDGKADIMVSNINSNTISLFRNIATAESITTSSFSQRVDIPTGLAPASVLAADLDGDGKLDLIVGQRDETKGLSVFRNISSVGSLVSSSFAPKVDYDVSGPRGLNAAGDLDGDGKPDIVVATGAPFNLVSILRNTVAPATLLGEYSPDTNTVLLLHMNESNGSTASDASSYSNNGTATGTTIVDGRFGKARSLNGSSDLVEGTSSQLNFGSANFTLETWLKSSSTSSQAIWTSTGSNIGLYLAGGGGGGFFDLDINNGAGSGTNFSGQKVNDGKWHHVAAVRIGSQGFLYVDGRLDFIDNLTQNPGNSTQYRVGSSFPGSFFNGLIDEVRISNIARSPNEFTLQLPPKNLTANASGTTINLTWQNGGGALPLMRYKIYRGLDSTSQTVIDSTISAFYSNSGLLAGNKYYYRISAVDSTGFEGARSYSASATAVGLVGWYPMNGSANDSSGNGNNGILNGPTLTDDRFGMPNRAFSFNGTSNFITVSTSPSLQSPTTQITIASWAKIQGWYNGQWIPILSKGQSTVEYHLMFTNIIGLRAELGLPQPVDIPEAPPFGVWSFLCMTYDGSTIIYYRNGLEVARKNYVGSFQTGNANLHIGRDVPGSIEYFNGSLDDIRIYNRALSVGEIDSLYHLDGWGLPPTITDFTPKSGPVGTTVTITGTNFNTTAVANKVYFGAVKAAISSATSISLTVTVPVGATFAPITVTDTTTGLTAYSNKPFIVTFSGGGSITTSSFASKVDFMTGINPPNVAIGDVDGDGRLDLAVSNEGSNTVSVFRNTGTSGSVSFAAKVDFTTGSGPLDVAIGDVDGDGKPDLVVANDRSHTVSVFRNTCTSGTVSFGAKVDFTTGTSPVSVAIGDADGDGKPDLAVANWNSNTVSILRNTGTSGSISFATKVDFTTGTNPWSIDVGDVDGDGKSDLAVVNVNSNTVSVFRNTGTSGSVLFAAKVDFSTGLGPQEVAIGDVDGDGKPDLAVANNASNSVSIFRNTGTSGSVSFGTKIDFPTGSNPGGVAIGDVDGDGKPDVAVANVNSNTVSVFRNTATSGSVSFGAKLDFTTGSSPGSVAIGDVDGDGKPDLIAGNYNSNTVSVFRNTVGPATLLGEYSPDANTVLLLHMNETSDSTVSDASNYGNNGTATGTTIVDGRFGKARRFDGNSDLVQISEPNPINFSSSNRFTLEGWVRIDNLTTRDAQIVGKWVGGSADWTLNVTTEGKVELKFFNGVSTFTTVRSNTVLQQFTWYHIAGIWNGDIGFAAVYVNGKIDLSTNSAVGSLAFTNTAPLVGVYFSGRVDEIRLSNQVRTPNEFNLQLPPKNPTVTASGSTINWSWQNGGGAVPLMKYKIYRGNDSVNVAFIDSTTSTSHSLPIFPGADTSYYRISAVDLTGFEGAKSYAVKPTVVTSAPAAPSSVTATAVSSTQINLSWTDNSDNEEGFKIERKIGSAGTYSEIATAIVGVTTFQNTGLNEGTNYYYRVRAYNAVGNSNYSSEANATTPDVTAPTSPLNVQITPSGWSNQNQSTITWSNPPDVSGIPQVWYRIDAIPNVGSPGTGVNISSPSLQLTISTPGVTTIFFYLADGAGNKNPSSAVSVLAKYDNILPTISHDSSAVSEFNTASPGSIAIAATASDAHSGMKSLQLQYRRSGTSWSTASTVNYASVLGGSASIPAANITAMANFGVDYRVAATDSANNVKYTPTFSIGIRYNQEASRTDGSGNPVTQPSTSSLPAGAPQEYAYRMFSVPLNLDNKTPRDVFETRTGLGVYDSKQWRFYSLNNSDGFDEYPSLSSSPVLDPGKSFFLSLKSGAVIKIGPGSIVKADSVNKAGIQLRAGNNFVGNPFNFNVPIDSLSLSNGDLFTGRTWEFVGVGGTNGGWSLNPTTLKAWEGILVRTTSATVMKVKIADRPGSAPPSIAKRQEEVGSSARWRVQIRATRTDNGLADIENILGVEPSASAGIDAFDAFEPPLFGQKTLSLSFPSPEAELTHDFRPFNDEGYVWDFMIQTPDEKAHVLLSFDGLSDVALPIRLLDLDTKMTHTLNEASRIEVNTSRGERHFRLIVGSLEFAQKHSEGIRLVPTEFALYQNYPNPFNPETIVRYSIPGSSSLYHVSLKVYNLLGQDVTTLVEADQGPGFYEAKLDGRTLSSGVYFYRIAINGVAEGSSYSSIKKMMLLK